MKRRRLWCPRCQRRALFPTGHFVIHTLDMLRAASAGMPVMALKPENPVVGGTVLRRAMIRSPNYVAGVSGWTINQDGSAEFNNLTIRGTFMGTDYEINASGAFFYSGAPAAGNLIASTTTAGGTDSFGNNYLANVSSYGAGFAASLNGGFVNLYSGSLAGGWSVTATIEGSTGAQGLILTAALSILLGDAVTAAAGLAVTGGLTTDTLSVNGSGSTGVPSNNSTSTNGLTSGVINGTSGAQSTGTAHTHSAGSYAVANGQHAHNLNSHTHVF